MLNIEDKLRGALRPGSRRLLYPRSLMLLMIGEVSSLPYLKDQEAAAENERVAAALVNEGWVAAGAGAFSLVLKHPDMPGKVLKLVLTDDEYMSWVEHCAARQGQPFVPVIHSYGEVLGCPFAVLDELELDQDRARFFVNMATAVYYALEDDRYAPELFECPEFADLVSDACGMGALDIHDENIMFHPVTGEAFLTDPIT